MSDDALVRLAQFTKARRGQLADKGHAMPDGSFPIRNKSDLSNAVSAFGRAKDKAAAKKHIVKRAKAIGATYMLPDSWKNSVAASSPYASGGFITGSGGSSDDRVPPTVQAGEYILTADSSASPVVSLSAHDLIFYANRSTPEVVAKGASGKPKANYGKQTRRRPATPEEEKKIAKGDWVQVDQSGKKSGEDGYKKTKIRPGLVKASVEDDMMIELSFNEGDQVYWYAPSGMGYGVVTKVIPLEDQVDADEGDPEDGPEDDGDGSDAETGPDNDAPATEDGSTPSTDARLEAMVNEIGVQREVSTPVETGGSPTSADNDADEDDEGDDFEPDEDSYEVEVYVGGVPSGVTITKPGAELYSGAVALTGMDQIRLSAAINRDDYDQVVELAINWSALPARIGRSLTPKLVKVRSHNANRKGRSIHVKDYVRRILASFGNGADAHTRRGMFNDLNDRFQNSHPNLNPAQRRAAVDALARAAKSRRIRPGQAGPSRAEGRRIVNGGREITAKRAAPRRAGAPTTRVEADAKRAAPRRAKGSTDFTQTPRRAKVDLKKTEHPTASGDFKAPKAKVREAAPIKLPTPTKAERGAIQAIERKASTGRSLQPTKTRGGKSDLTPSTPRTITAKRTSAPKVATTESKPKVSTPKATSTPSAAKKVSAPTPAKQTAVQTIARKSTAKTLQPSGPKVGDETTPRKVKITGEGGSSVEALRFPTLSKGGSNRNKNGLATLGETHSPLMASLDAAGKGSKFHFQDASGRRSTFTKTDNGFGKAYTSSEGKGRSVAVEELATSVMSSRSRRHSATLVKNDAQVGNVATPPKQAAAPKVAVAKAVETPKAPAPTPSVKKAAKSSTPKAPAAKKPKAPVAPPVTFDKGVEIPKGKEGVTHLDMGGRRHPIVSIGTPREPDGRTGIVNVRHRVPGDDGRGTVFNIDTHWSMLQAGSKQRSHAEKAAESAAARKQHLEDAARQAAAAATPNAPAAKKALRR